MYLVQVDHVIYERRGGGSFTLVEALRELRGTRHARILREDGSPVVDRAGSDSAVLHVATGREVRRRSVRR
jgi:hypothetical protein